MEMIIHTEFSGGKLLEVAVVRETGETLLHTRVRPADLTFDRQWQLTSRIHGIRPVDVDDAPPQFRVQREVLALCSGHRVIGYGVGADIRHFPGLRDSADVVCAMTAYRALTGQKTHLRLREVLRTCAIPWTFGRTPGALADALATLALWHWLRTRTRDDVTPQLARATRVDAPAPAEPSGPTSTEDCLAGRARAMAARYIHLAPRTQPCITAAPDGCPPRYGRTWTRDETQALRRFWQRGRCIAEIAEALGRSDGGVVARIVHLGLAADGDAVRAVEAHRAQVGP